MEPALLPRPRVIYSADLEHWLAVAEENPKGLASDYKKNHSHVNGVAKSPRWLTRNEVRWFFGIVPVEVCLNSVVDFLGDGLPTLAYPPNIVEGQTLKRLVGPVNGRHILSTGP